MRARSRWTWTLALLLAAVPANADWLVFLGGGLQETRGRWEIRDGLVRFHSPTGTLHSVRASDVDLAASAFLTWQVGERRRELTALPPAGAEMHSSETATESTKEVPCVPAKVVRVLAAESLEIESAGRRETVHLACLDAPETRHRFPQLAWFGAEARATVEKLAPGNSSLCVVEENPPLRDRQRHRIVYVRLGDGRDLGAEVIARGYGLVRSGGCVRRATYLELEAAALTTERGLWGPSGNDASLAIASRALGFSAAPAPRARSGSS